MNIPNSLKSVYQPRKSRLKSCNGKCTLDIPSLEGYSYGYWQVVKVINDLVVFNDYQYSHTTSRHQSQIRSWLAALGIDIDLVVKCPDGLQYSSWADTSVSHDIQVIAKLTAEMKYGTKNEWRISRIKETKERVEAITELVYISPKKIREDLKIETELAFHNLEINRKWKSEERIKRKIERVKQALITGKL